MSPQRISPEKRTQASILRHNTTEAESRLWTFLRANRLNNIHFRRQHPIGKYIVDFCAPREKLIIEVDGSQHLLQNAQDKERTVFLEAKGYRVLRFWNNEVTNSLEDVLLAIIQAISDKR